MTLLDSSIVPKVFNLPALVFLAETTVVTLATKSPGQTLNLVAGAKPAGTLALTQTDLDQVKASN